VCMDYIGRSIENNDWKRLHLMEVLAIRAFGAVVIGNGKEK